MILMVYNYIKNGYFYENVFLLTQDADIKTMANELFGQDIEFESKEVIFDLYEQWRTRSGKNLICHVAAVSEAIRLVIQDKIILQLENEVRLGVVEQFFEIEEQRKKQCV